MSLGRFLRPGERIGLVRCCRLAHSPFRRFAHSLPGSFLRLREIQPYQGQSFRNHYRLVWFNETAGEYLPSINGVV